MTQCQQIFSVDNFIIFLTQFPIYDILSGLAGGVKLASLRAHPPQNLRPGVIYPSILSPHSVYTWAYRYIYHAKY
jgi:hypothetical protein